MTFVIRNQAGISNKYIRFAKWKIRQLSSKYTALIYSEIYIKKIANSPSIYEVTIKLGVPGPDIIISGKSKDLKPLWSQLSSRIKRQLSKYAARQK